MNIFKQYSGLRKEMYVLFFGRIVTCLGSMVHPLLTLILSNKLHFNAASIASLFLILSLVQVPMTYIAGYLADHYNKRNIIIVCDSVSIIAYFIAGCIELSMLTIGLIFIASLFATIEYPVYDALVADLSSYEEREKAYSLNYLGANLGIVIAPTIGGILFAHYLNLAFFIDAISTLASTILIFLYIKDIHVSKSSVDIDTYEESAHHESVGKVLKKRKIILFFVLCITMIEIVYSQFNFLLPLNLENLYGEQGAMMFGTITSVNALVVIFATPIFTTLSQRMKDIDKIILGVFFMVIGFGMYIFIQGMIPLYYISMIIFTFGEIYNALGSKPYLTRRIPSTHRGRISSIVRIVVNLSVAVSQNAIGYLIDSETMIFVWTFITCLGFITFFLVLILRYFDKREYSLLYSK